MQVHPIVSWWLIASIGSILLGLSVWQLILRFRHKSNTLAWARRSAIVACLIMMSIGTSVPGGMSPAGMLNLDVIFAVDTTISSGAEDYTGSKPRLDGMKKDLLALTEKMSGARFSIVTFDAKSTVLLPMTSDRSSVDVMLASLDREHSAYSKGSSIDQPIDAVLKQLVIDKKQNPQRPNIVFYLGDGEQTAKNTPKSFDSLSSFVSGGAVLGYGTSTGAKMKKNYGYYTGNIDPCKDIYGSCYIEWYEPLSNQPIDAISKINESALQKIAGEMKVGYVNRNDGGNIGSLVDLSKIESIAQSSRQVSYYVNLYWVFALPVIGLLLWELLYFMKRWLELTPVKGVKS